MIHAAALLTTGRQTRTVLPKYLQVILMATNITSKGQVTVPKSIRDYLGLKPGSAVIFERAPGGEVVLRPAGRGAKRQPSRFAKLRGRGTVRMKTDAILALTRGPEK
jgi:AbrB family looped-hinge helix DNA binding protein